MRYTSPSISLIEIDFISKNQGSGTPVIPLNPNCGSSGCENTFIGEFCVTVVQTGTAYDVHYFVPNLPCETLGETPCTVNVSGNVLSCTAEHTCTDTASCNNQSGSIIRCSGILPNIFGCSGLQATVECTGASDADSCGPAI